MDSDWYGGYMDNLVRIYNDVMTDEKCQYFIDKFEAHPEMQEIQNNSQDKTLTFINLMSSPDTPFREDLNFLSNLFMENVEKYKKNCRIKPFQFPDKFGVEAYKIKRYLPNTTDEFPAHVDVRDRATARRFLVMFVYLTDNYAGQTELEVLAGKSPCRRGSILLFPPLWPWVHAGKAPVKNPKYIIGSYLQYV